MPRLTSMPGRISCAMRRAIIVCASMDNYPAATT
jgi:hypothetical protein